jgi:hypothetical protein
LGPSDQPDKVILNISGLHCRIKLSMPLGLPDRIPGGPSMKAVGQMSGASWIGLLTGLALGGTVLAQTVEVSSSPASGSSSTLAAYLQERQTLAQERQALVAEGAPRSNWPPGGSRTPPSFKRCSNWRKPSP